MSRSANGASGPQFRCGFFTGLFNYRQRVFAAEWCSAGEQIEQDGADAIDVGRSRDMFRRAMCLFRRDVTGRAENCQCAGQIA